MFLTIARDGCCILTRSENNIPTCTAHDTTIVVVAYRGRNSTSHGTVCNSCTCSMSYDTTVVSGFGNCCCNSTTNVTILNGARRITSNTTCIALTSDITINEVYILDNSAAGISK